MTSRGPFETAALCHADQNRIREASVAGLFESDHPVKFLCKSYEFVVRPSRHNLFLQELVDVKLVPHSNDFDEVSDDGFDDNIITKGSARKRTLRTRLDKDEQPTQSCVPIRRPSPNS